ncbi:hypothetical protein BN2537_9153 [Streptomyces venezuelae]|nr:hypothetical protein BN2537_9153 [Streptomyces venezuelae]
MRSARCESTAALADFVWGMPEPGEHRPEDGRAPAPPLSIAPLHTV